MPNESWIPSEYEIQKIIIKDYTTLSAAQEEIIDENHIFTTTATEEIKNLIYQVNTLSKESSMMISFSPEVCNLTRVLFLDIGDRIVYQISIYNDRIQRPDAGGFHHTKEEKEKEKNILNILEKIRNT